MPKIYFIHGLNSSHRSFTYIAKELDLPLSKIDYMSQQALGTSIEQVLKQIPKDEPIILIGHSLGGVIAMNIAHAGVRNVQKIITISSPLGGSRAAIYARWVVSGLPVLNDIVPSSPYIRPLAKLNAPCEVLSIFSTSGSLPTSQEPNDSVVTVASQKALPFAKKIEVKANHFEVLLHDKTVDAISKFL